MVDTRTFDVLLRPEPEGGFTVRVPAFPEIVTYGSCCDILYTDYSAALHVHGRCRVSNSW